MFDFPWCAVYSTVLIYSLRARVEMANMQPHTLDGCYMYLHLPYKLTKCR